MRDFRPFLQIVHGWGLRAAAPGLQAYRGVRALARSARASGDAALAAYLDGACAHDGYAALAFRELLEAIALGDPLWRKLPTWVLDSGDRSLVGDRESLALGESLHRSFAVASNARAAVAVPGPRDDWPGAPPALRPAEAVQQRAWARVHAFPAGFPTPPVVERAPTGRLEVQLFAMDTVAPGAGAATAGRGHLARSDLARLGTLADQARRGDEVRALRVLLVHHPLDRLAAHGLDRLAAHGLDRLAAHGLDRLAANGFDRLAANGLDRLAANGPEALAAVAGPSPAGLRPLVHLVLHGEAHAPQPPLGALAARDAVGLGVPQSLAVGPLLGFDPTGARGNQPQQCQVLRLYCSAARPHAVLVERLIASRLGGVGPFRFVPVAADGEVAEERVIAV